MAFRKKGSENKLTFFLVNFVLEHVLQTDVPPSFMFDNSSEKEKNDKESTLL